MKAYELQKIFKTAYITLNLSIPQGRRLEVMFDSRKILWISIWYILIELVLDIADIISYNFYNHIHLETIAGFYCLFWFIFNGREGYNKIMDNES